MSLLHSTCIALSPKQQKHIMRIDATIQHLCVKGFKTVKSINPLPTKRGVSGAGQKPQKKNKARQRRKSGTLQLSVSSPNNTD